MAGGARVGDGLALSIHGPTGVVDLLVPRGAAVGDVAREYAVQSGLASAPALGTRLFTRLGAPLAPDRSLEQAGVVSGDLLVAVVPPSGETVGEMAGDGAGHGAGDGDGAGHGAASAAPATPGPTSGRGSVWLSVALAVGAACGGLGGWYAAGASGTPRQAALGLLVLAAVLGVLPVGRVAARRSVVAPVFAGAAAYAIAWDPRPERLPTVVGVAALTAAVAAAVARSLNRRPEEALRVWVWAGGGVFVLTAATALLGAPPAASWGALLLAALLAARFVPGLAVDVPDQYLLDLERLAVTAWSARERPRGRRGRTMVPPEAVATVARRGARLVGATSVAVLGVAAVSAPLLLRTSDLPVDRIGGRCLVFLVGGGLLLTARNHRHAVARSLLRAAGLACWLALAAATLPAWTPRQAVLVGVGAVVLGVVVAAAAVATGRGWRSAWWSRRAEVAESLASAAAIASLLVAAGAFRTLWESIHMDV